LGESITIGLLPRFNVYICDAFSISRGCYPDLNCHEFIVKINEITVGKTSSLSQNLSNIHYLCHEERYISGYCVVKADIRMNGQSQDAIEQVLSALEHPESQVRLKA